MHDGDLRRRAAVAAVLEHYPNALVAVEERGVGYRVNRHFPDGEITGEMILSRRRRARRANRSAA